MYSPGFLRGMKNVTSDMVQPHRIRIMGAIIDVLVFFAAQSRASVWCGRVRNSASTAIGIDARLRHGTRIRSADVIDITRAFANLIKEVNTSL